MQAWDLPAPSLQTGSQQGLSTCPIKTSEVFGFTKQSLPQPILSLPLWLWASAPSPGSLALSSSGGLQPPGGCDVLRLLVSLMEFGANVG